MNEKEFLKEFRQILNEELDTRFADFEARMDAKMDARFADFEARMDAKMDQKLELQFDKICVSVSETMEVMIENSERRMKKYMDERFDAVEARIGHVETRINLTDGRLLNVEKRQYNIEERINAQANIVAEKVSAYMRGEGKGE